MKGLHPTRPMSCSEIFLRSVDCPPRSSTFRKKLSGFGIVNFLLCLKLPSPRRERPGVPASWPHLDCAGLCAAILELGEGNDRKTSPSSPLDHEMPGPSVTLSDICDFMPLPTPVPGRHLKLQHTCEQFRVGFSLACQWGWLQNKCGFKITKYLPSWVFDKFKNWF